jgi:hypothetical protein
LPKTSRFLPEPGRCPPLGEHLLTEDDLREGTLPLVSRVSLKGGVILGENISGYTLGAGFSF